MLCVTGGERRCAELARRLQDHRGEALQEVRLDLLEDLDEGTFALVRGGSVLVSCRGPADGGAFRGSEAARLELLRRALREQPGYLDVELAVPPEVWSELALERGTTRLVCSHHALAPGADIAGLGRALAAVPAQLYKLAVAVEDAAELLPLLALELPAPLVRIGMGAAGILSRALASRFRSPFTFVHADSAPATAPGQLGLAEARAWRIDESASLRPLALLGGEQVVRSPGPTVYNRLFRARGLPFIYLPVVSRRAPEVLALLDRLGFAGASVTMPLKESVAGLLEILEPPADRIGAVNTVDLGARRGMNSDAAAIGDLVGPGQGRRALVLGAGGAARAAATVLAGDGWAVALCGRSRERCDHVARELSVRSIAWEERHAAPAALIVNATPCGSHGEDDPLADRGDLGGAILLEMIVREGGTPLLRRALAAGARAISGEEMWLAQGALQMSWLTGETIAVPDLRRCLP